MSTRSLSILSGFVFAAASFAPSLLADQWSKKTIITVNEAVQLPSCCTPDHLVTLQPGTYVLVLVDSLSDRHIVRVMDKSETKVILTTLAIPNYRLKVRGKTTFQYWETPAGQPKMMRAWFYPGDNFGQEFAYHKAKSIELAKIVMAPVPAIAVETTEEADLRTAALVVVDPKGTEVPVKVEAPQAAVVARVEAAPDPAPAPVAAAATQEPAAAVSAPAALPNTASSYPLIGSIGMAMLLAYGVMSFISKRQRKFAINRSNVS